MKTAPLGLMTLLVVFAALDSATAADPPEGYALAWSDEFNKDGPLDPDEWSFERGFVRNEELQWYQPENAFCENGMLVIEGRRESFPNPRYRQDARSWRRNRERVEYTSASVTTRRGFTWQYGVLEVRAKITAAPGLWPAIWTLGVREGWPACGEVDVMEYYDGGILANVAWQGRRRIVWDDTKRPITELGENWDDDFHVWRMKWDDERIELSVDGRVLNETDTSRAEPREGRVHPFKQPHYLLLNLAIGGTRGGDPSGTEFPTRYLIDYARVYQKTESTQQAEGRGQ